MPNVFIGHSAGDVLPAADWQTNWNLAEASFGVVGPYIQAGLVPTAGTGLAVNVSSGNALIGANIVKSGAWSITALADNTVNHLYLLQNGTGTSNTTGTAPANSVKLGTATTAGGVVTSVNTGRSSGRQQFVAPQSLVHGGLALGITSAGHPASINLASWAASPGEGVQVSGVLPAGAAVASPVAVVTKTGNYTLLYTDYYVRGNAAGGGFTLTLPTAVGHDGQIFIIKKTDGTANAVTIATTGGQTIDGGATAVITTPNVSLTLIAAASNWELN